MNSAGKDCGSLLLLCSYSSSAGVWILWGLQSFWEYFLCHGARTSLTLVLALLFLTLLLLLCLCGVYALSYIRFHRGTTSLVDGLSCVLWCGSRWNWTYLAHNTSCSLLKEANLAVPPLPAACHLHGCPCNWGRSGGQSTDQSSSVASMVLCFSVPLPLPLKHEGMKRIQPSFSSFSSSLSLEWNLCSICLFGCNTVYSSLVLLELFPA